MGNKLESTVSEAITSHEDIQDRKIKDLESKVNELEYKVHANKILFIVEGTALTLIYIAYFISRLG